jgi:hypothetical protein
MKVRQEKTARGEDPGADHRSHNERSGAAQTQDAWCVHFNPSNPIAAEPSLSTPVGAVHSLDRKKTVVALSALSG